ncbi:hypothetical protein NL676_033983 [Syzygium grande]|nr:hypothetical protein NL676_033983 [Syzygium grande]
MMVFEFCRLATATAELHQIPAMAMATYQNHKPPLYPRLATAMTEWNRILSADSAALATVLIATLMLMTVMAMDIAVYPNHKLPPYLRLATALMAQTSNATPDCAWQLRRLLIWQLRCLCAKIISLQYSSTLMAVTM